MSIYREHILPRLIDWSMRAADFDAYRRRLAAQARGRVLEIGIGAGLNLPLYGTEVEMIVGLDPSATLLERAAEAAAQAARPVGLLRAQAEAIPLSDASIDTVMMTWTLCSVSDAPRALAEMRRVLRPGGQLLFVEHGLAPEPRVASWQHRLDPLWTRVSCHLDNPVDALLRDAGFSIEKLDAGYMRRWPKTLTYMYEGRARVGSSPEP